MMAWPEEPRSRNDIGDWSDVDFLETSTFYPADSEDERAQHGATNFLSASQDMGQAGLTNSASCPSFSDLDHERDPMDRSTFMGFSIGSEDPIMENMSSTSDTAFGVDRDFEMLLQFQENIQDTLQRQFPSQHVIGQPLHEVQQQQLQMGGVRRGGFHGSHSFTNLSSMESDFHGMCANKTRRKKGSDRWMQLQRHKSFDSTITSESFNLDLNSTSRALTNSSNTVPDQPLREPPKNETIGLSMDNSSTSMPPNDSSWSPVVYGSAPSSIGGSYMQQFHTQERHDDMASFADTGAVSPIHPLTDAVSMSELDMLMSDSEHLNLFDAIRDFDLPDRLESVNAEAPLKPPQPTTTIGTQKQSNTPSTRKKQTMDQTMDSPPEIHKRVSLDDSRTIGDSSSSASPAGICVPMRTRLHQILVQSVQNSDAGSSLSSYERNYLMQSPLFFPAKAPKTAGSLWLLLHAAQCEGGCDIADCSVMRRVLSHCLGCELIMGKCKQPCNDAKAMLLHYGSCNSKGSMHGRSCSVCWNLLEIDYSYQALGNGNGGGRPSGQTSSSSPSSFVSTSSSPIIGTPTFVPVAVIGSSHASRSPSKCSRSGSSTSKHVPIQPNLLPTTSNPTGLVGALPPHFGYRLSSYLEQTSAPFRAEVKSRIEKRVTSAASQDLLQHMQKKTRLRSLDDLRLEARTIVLGEMERELHHHMQTYDWANSTVGGGRKEHQNFLRT
ncbi:hypothetical protein PsorP6_005997 [Peronosclerospora sorghi]|uniref:Uncharacterized protein n=1 Tax=Peronosclerospora sorghi TaxID=230839 RepID=A0ACC0W628_9STRA|nr:hypothetical protein PsorP6_005997 [Peronosclerospora sorghi]